MYEIEFSWSELQGGLGAGESIGTNFARTVHKGLQMDHTYQYLIALLAGLISGVVSEVGGAGTLVSLPMLIGAGLPPVVANGTNRIGVMLLYTMGYFQYRRGHKSVIGEAVKLSIPVIAGTVAGALFATRLDNIVLDWMVVGTTVVVIVASAMMPQLFCGESSTQKPSRSAKPADYLLLLGVGFYCGLVQSGMSYLIFYVLVQRMNTQTRTAEALKSFISMIVTPFALAIFIYYGHINWMMGLFIAIGAGAGGWIGSMISQKWEIAKIKKSYILMLILSLIYVLIFMLINFKNGIREI